MKRILFVLAGALLAASQAKAQFPGDIPDNVRLHFGGIFALFSTDTRVTIKNPDIPGTDIDIENLLGTPDHKFAFRGDGYWNFLGRSYLDFGYSSFHRSAEKSIARDIVINGVTYTVGADVSTEMDERFIYAAYRYGFVKNPSFQLGASLGVSYARLKASLSASGGVVGPEGEILGGTVTKEAEIQAPIPLVGIDLTGALSRQVTLGGYVRGFGANIGDYSGNMIDAGVRLDWYVARNIGVGAGYDYNHIHITKETDTRKTEFKTRYDGPRFYLTVTF
ncbi:MAG: hypothetical protein ACM3JH_13355 [Acidithiobacillales bacterium]